MKVIVKARHMNLTAALKTYAEEKLGDALARIFDRPAATIEIELEDVGNVRNGVDKECRVTVFMPKGKTINIVEDADNMYKAIDLAHDRLLQQVKRQREKHDGAHNGRKLAERERFRIFHFRFREICFAETLGNNRKQQRQVFRKTASGKCGTIAGCRERERHAAPSEHFSDYALLFLYGTGIEQLSGKAGDDVELRRQHVGTAEYAALDHNDVVRMS